MEKQFKDFLMKSKYYKRIKKGGKYKYFYSKAEYEKHLKKKSTKEIKGKKKPRLTIESKKELGAEGFEAIRGKLGQKFQQDIKQGKYKLPDDNTKTRKDGGSDIKFKVGNDVIVSSDASTVKQGTKLKIDKIIPPKSKGDDTIYYAGGVAFKDYELKKVEQDIKTESKVKQKKIKLEHIKQISDAIQREQGVLKLNKKDKKKYDSLSKEGAWGAMQRYTYNELQRKAISKAPAWTKSLWKKSKGNFEKVMDILKENKQDILIKKIEKYRQDGRI